jgi:hypothetical protein
MSRPFARRVRGLLLPGALLVGALAGVMHAPALLGAAPWQTAAQQAALAALIPVQMGATIDHDTVTVGDVIRLTVRVRAPQGATINFPSGANSLGAVQSLETPTVTNGADSANAADRIAVYRLAAWDVGPLTINLGEALVQTDDGERRIALALPPLFVRSVLPADSTLHIPKPPRPLLPVRAVMPWWWWALAALAAVVIGLGLWWWRRRRGRALGPTGDPFADAERGFERVDRMGLVAAGEPGRHVVLTADILRRYLADRLHEATLAQTSGEMLRALRGVPTVPHDRLERLLATVDGVKFARAPIAAETARTVGMEARAIVREEHERAAAIEAAALARAQASRQQKAAA